MKKLEDIEKEYESFTTDRPYINSVIELLVYIEIGLDKLVEDQESATKEIRYMKRDMFMLKLMDFVTMSPIEEDIDISFLEADIEAVNKEVNLSNNQAFYFARIAEAANPDNFKELLRLVDFSCEYYNKSVDYIDYLRDVYEFQRKGINMYHGGKEDNSEVFDKFMQKKLAEFEKGKEKPVEKRLMNPKISHLLVVLLDQNLQ